MMKHTAFFFMGVLSAAVVCGCAGMPFAVADMTYSEGSPRAAGTGTPVKPSWVDSPPAEYGGLPCATGVAASRIHHRDAATASYEDALFALVKNSLAQVYASGQMTEYAMLDASLTLVRGPVKGFYIRETWRDPASGAVWTLAAAREVIRVTNE
jgi:hypothetical protein